MAKSDEDDLGLPENPTYSNYSNRMWKAHTNTRHGLVQSPERSRESAHGGRLPQDEPPAAKDNPPLVVEEDRRDKEKDYDRQQQDRRAFYR